MTDRFPKVAAVLGSIAGAAAALAYYRQGLTLSHYDAKAHLVVARRVLDSLTPEYSQIGAVWLPLPHVLNMIPVQIDWLYRTGLSGVVLSIAAFAAACFAIAAIVQRITGSTAAAAISVALFAASPDVLYLQSTPMTEPLLFALVLLSVLLTHDWIALAAPVDDRRRAAAADVARAQARAGWVLVAACLTRYEAWMTTAALLPLAVVALWRRGAAPYEAIRRGVRLGLYPALAILGFFVHSWYTTGAWFVTGGFYVPDNPAHGDVIRAFMSVQYGVRTLVGRPVLIASLAAAAVLLARSLARREHASALVALSLWALLALPTYAFFQGHPFRMRYMVAPSVTAAVFAGIAVGQLSGWGRRLAVAAAAVWLAATASPMNPQAPMVLEAQWDVPFSQGRRTVTSCLERDYRGELILASMGSLAHYMQELSHAGIHISDFVHEGNLPYWQESIEAPQGRVGWILMEERAEGGDLLAARARAASAFTSGFTRVCEGGGVALYRAQ